MIAPERRVLNASAVTNDMSPDSANETDIDIEVSDTQSHIRVDARRVAAWAEHVLRGEGVTRAQVSIALVDDSVLHALNRRFLGHDWRTDVVTFPLEEGSKGGGEVVVSAEMAVTEAAQRGIEPGDELALYVVHGVLHLCGHDDQDDESAARMRVLEAGHLKTLADVGLLARAECIAGEAPCRVS